MIVVTTDRAEMNDLRKDVLMSRGGYADRRCTTLSTRVVNEISATLTQLGSNATTVPRNSLHPGQPAFRDSRDVVDDLVMHSPILFDAVNITETVAMAVLSLIADKLDLQIFAMIRRVSFSSVDDVASFVFERCDLVRNVDGDVILISGAGASWDDSKRALIEDWWHNVHFYLPIFISCILGQITDMLWLALIPKIKRNDGLLSLSITERYSSTFADRCAAVMLDLPGASYSPNQEQSFHTRYVLGKPLFSTLPNHRHSAAIRSTLHSYLGRFLIFHPSRQELVDAIKLLHFVSPKFRTGGFGVVYDKSGKDYDRLGFSRPDALFPGSFDLDVSRILLHSSEASAFYVARLHDLSSRLRSPFSRPVPSALPGLFFSKIFCSAVSDSIQF